MQPGKILKQDGVSDHGFKATPLPELIGKKRLQPSNIKQKASKKSSVPPT
jgi:hypothetical protein